MTLVGDGAGQMLPAHQWRSAAEAAASAGARFASLFACHGSRGRELHLVLSRGGEHLVHSAAIEHGQIDSIIDVFPAAAWDEREAHDLYGIRFTGHQPLRPLVHHPADLASWTIPVDGHDVHQVAVGPIHAGVIESGHFRFHVVGERILHLDVRLFYKHRGLEFAAEDMLIEDAIGLARRACGGCAVANSVAYAHAAERALGLVADPAVQHARTVLLELERVWNHCNDLSAICAGVGFAAGSMALAALKERAQRVNDAIAGHRFLFDTVRVGRSDLELTAKQVKAAAAELAAIVADAVSTWREVMFSASVQDRFAGIGQLTHDDALRLGAVGPAARACGVPQDVRHEMRELPAYDGFVPVLPGVASGDVAARAEMRALELDQTGQILGALLVGGIDAGRCHRSGEEGELSIARVESPRGQTTCCVIPREGRVARMHLRSASYANWPVVAHVAPGNLIPDFPLINKSFELCYACADR